MPYWLEELVEGLCVSLIIVSVVVVIASIIIGIEWIGVGYQVKVVNEAYGTNYTQAEYFWTGNTIKNYLSKRGKIQTVNIEGLN